MSYSFLKKAKTQPDLSDFCEYVNKPLMILEDILQRYEELQLSKKVTTENLEIYHKCDSILQKHLPEMVDNFCNFSFEYRNNEKITVDDNTSLTAKEILLKNLAKIIEEVKLIEKDFNRNNSFQAIVQTRFLSNYGFQPELSLETGKITKESIELNNKFDYEKFVENHEFKKPIVLQEKNDEIELVNKSNYDKPVEHNELKKTIALQKKNDEIELNNKSNYDKFIENRGFKKPIVFEERNKYLEVVNKNSDEIYENQEIQINENGGNSFATIIFGILFIVAATVGFFSFTGSVYEEETNSLGTSLSTSIANINSTIKQLHPKSDYSSLSNDELLKAHLTEDTFKTPWGTHIEITSYLLNRYAESKGTEPNLKQDAYALKFDLAGSKSNISHKQSCQIISNIANKFEIVTFGEYSIKTDKPLTQEEFVHYCNDVDSTPIKFDRDTITLVSK